MRSVLIVCTLILSSLIGYSQKDKGNTKNSKTELTKDNFLDSYSSSACECIDSISDATKPKSEITQDISSCIEYYAKLYNIISGLSSVYDDSQKDASSSKKDKTKKEYVVEVGGKSERKAYSEMENYLLANCKALNTLLGSNDVMSSKSYSEDKDALDFYNKGIIEGSKNNWEAAVKNYKSAVLIDENFAFAWDNLGLSYRKLENFDSAIYCYKKSIEIDPNGTMPYQNIAVAYRYKKDYNAAIKAYEVINKRNPNDPESAYGIATVKILDLKQFEEGLPYACKAYLIYEEQKSPYKSHAIDIISFCYAYFKEKGEEAKFIKIMNDNGITIAD